MAECFGATSIIECFNCRYGTKGGCDSGPLDAMELRMFEECSEYDDCSGCKFQHSCNNLKSMIKNSKDQIIKK
jgi:hypothetical protein